MTLSNDKLTVRGDMLDYRVIVNPMCTVVTPHPTLLAPPPRDEVALTLLTSICKIALNLLFD